MFLCFKLVVQAMRQSSPEDFWATFTVNKQRLGYSVILQRLHEARRAENNHLAQLAREEYGSEFDTVFGYKKGGTWVVKRKAGDIAKQYCKERGIEYLYDEDSNI